MQVFDKKWSIWMFIPACLGATVVFILLGQEAALAQESFTSTQSAAFFGQALFACTETQIASSYGIPSDVMSLLFNSIRILILIGIAVSVGRAAYQINDGAIIQVAAQLPVVIILAVGVLMFAERLLFPC